MTDAYRTSAFLCPVCREAPLREHQHRLVCDECQGMLLDADDFTASIRELDGSSDPLEVTVTGTTESACPRCRQPLAEATLAVGALALRGTFLHCTSHGTWFPRDAMTSVFARVSRRGGFRGLGATAGVASSRGGARGGSDAASTIGNMPSAHSGMSSAMASIAGAFGSSAPASGGLAISNWQAHRPRVHTLYVSAHKELQLTCPACRHALEYQGDRWACHGCAGSFVENAALAAMVIEMVNAPWDVPPITGSPGQRTCPICNVAMAVEPLEEVTVDRCAVHGVWFDATELETALHHAGDKPGWLSRLFHRR